MRKGKPRNIVQLAANEKGRFLDWHNGSKGGGWGTMGKFPAKTMTDKTLSPAAEAVMDAAFPAYEDEHLYTATCEQHAGMIAAAALRAAAETVVPTVDEPGWVSGNCCERSVEIARDCVLAELLAIATELENVK
jgi:hypothetical protein